MPPFLDRIARSAFGRTKPGVATAEAQAAWDSAMGRYDAARAGRRGLRDQTREEAFDPALDYHDPYNAHVIDPSGRVNDPMGPMTPGGVPPEWIPPDLKPPAQPASKISSSPALAKRIGEIIGATQEPPPWLSSTLGLPTMRDVPRQDEVPPWLHDTLGLPGMEEFRPPAPPEMRTAGPSVMERARQLAPSMPEMPQWGRDYIGARNRAGDALEGYGRDVDNWGRSSSMKDWLGRQYEGMRNWNGKVFAQGGDVQDDNPNDFFTPLPMQSPRFGPSHAVVAGAAQPSPLLAPASQRESGGDDPLMKLLGSIVGSVGKSGGGGFPGIGGGSMDMGFGGGSGSLYRAGGPVGFMRGGYPELYTRPVRSAFSTGGGQNYVGSGPGGGRGDEIDARLSPREYVMDAETVALAGDGDPDAGAKEFDRLRENLRRHKGKQLAEGKFSPDAKPLENYMSGKLTASDRLAHSGMGDGMRRRK